MLRIKDRPDLARIEDNKAVVSTDVEALAKYKARRRLALGQRDLQAEVDELRGSVGRLTGLVEELLREIRKDREL